MYAQKFRIETSMLCVTCIDMKPSERLERVWSRQQGRWSVKGPDTFRMSSSLVGSNVRAIVSLCLARKKPTFVSVLIQTVIDLHFYIPEHSHGARDR